MRWRISIRPTSPARSAQQPLGDGSAPLQFPKVNRKAKRDSVLSRAREPLPPLPPLLAIAPLPEPEPDVALKKDIGGRFDPYSKYEFSELPPAGSATPDVDLPYVDMPPAHLTAVAPQHGKGKDSALLFFGVDPIAPEREAIAP